MNEFAKRIAGFSQARLALLCTELQAKLERAEAARPEAIAIVGMACRFPGGANDLDAYWKLLESGTDAVSEIPRGRWDVEAFYDANPEAPGKMYSKHGAFLDQVDAFDPQFFNISPREAVTLDPQHRLLLEVTWEALENAGQDPLELRGTNTGVFVGIGADDYAKLQVRSAPAESVTAYTGTGNAYCYGAGRLSFFLGAQGPNLPVDTACSSSLVATHLACQSLRSRECKLAIVGGVHLMLSPIGSIFLSKARALSPDGRCKTFDARANGYTRGEGCGVIVLKRLSDALANGDRIHGVIRGSAVNHDGPSSGFTVPNGQAQQAVIKAALEAARVDAKDVSYVEVHGTGTALGDPIELRALAAVLGREAGRASDTPLAVGSVKTNIGHLEPAAGIAGLMKVILALQKRAIPAHLHLTSVNPHIDLDAGPFTIPTALTPWPGAERPRVAGVSSFGLSGTNAHVILEEAPAPAAPPVRAERPWHVFTLSAKDERALGELAGAYASRLEGTTDSLADICFTASAGRAHFVERLAVPASSPSELSAQLAAFSRGRTPAELHRGRVSSRSSARVAFLFTGQGAQYVGMGRELYDTQPTFRRALDRCAARLDALLPEPLLRVLFAEAGDPAAEARLERTEFAQPALFAVEYALAELWRSFGVEPSVMLGHSIGEYVAACLAGVFTLEDALDVVATRGRLMQSQPLDGAMAAFPVDAARLERALGGHSARVAIAAYNAPDRVVVSGEKDAVHALLRELGQEGIHGTALAVSHAFHSPLMDPILDEFEAKVRSVPRAAPRARVISNLTGALAGDELAQPSYWRRHLREAVRFEQGLRAAHALRCDVFLEIGPKPVLIGMGRRSVPAGSGTWVPSIRPGREWQELSSTLAALYVHGVPIQGRGVDRDYVRRRVSLPTYPFQRESYWLDLPAEARPETRESSAERAPLLLSEVEARKDRLLGPKLAALVSTCTDDGVMTVNRRVTAKLVFFTASRETGFFLNQKGKSIVVSIYLGPDSEFEAALAELDAYAAANDLDVTLFAKDDKVASLRRRGYSTTPLGVWQSIDDLRTFTLQGGAAKGLRSKVNSYKNLGNVSTVEYKAGSDRELDQAIVSLMDDWIVRKGKKAPFEAFLKEEILTGSLAPGYRLFLVRRGDEIDAVILLSPVEAKQGWVMDLEFYRAKMPSGALEFGITTILERLKAEGIFYYTLGATFGTQLGEHPNADPKVQDVLAMFHDRNILNGDGNFIFKSKFNPSSTRFYVCRPHGKSSDDLPQVLAMLADPGAETPPGASEPGARNGEKSARVRRSDARPLVGERVPLALEGAVFELDPGCEALAFLREHAIFGHAVMPATGYLEALLGAARTAFGAPRPSVSGFELHAAMTLRAEGEMRAQVVLTPDAAGQGTFHARFCSTVDSGSSPAWTTHATASVSLARVRAQTTEGAGLDAARARCVSPVGSSALYEKLHALGIQYGPSFRTVDELATCFGEAVGRVRLPASARTDGFAIHPILLDGCLHVHAAALLASQGERESATYLPVGIESFELYGEPGRELWSHVRVREVDGNAATIIADLTLYDAGGAPVADLRGFEVRRTSAETLRRLQTSASDPFYELRWQPEERASKRAPSAAGTWVVVGDGDGLAAAFAAELERHRHRAVLVSPPEPDEPLAAFSQRFVSALDTRSLRGVIHLAGTGRVPEDCASEPLRRVQATACRSALAIAQHLASSLAGKAELWVVTRGAQGVTAADVVSPAWATLWGLGRTIAQEHPEIWGGLVDLSPGSGSDEARRLAEEILGGSGEDHVVLRGNERWVGRLAAVTRGRAVTPLRFSPDGTHLITGGLGGLGLRVARWMVERGARHIALVSRRGLVSEDARKAVEALLASGIDVQVFAADVAREDEARALLGSIAVGMPPLCGVIHAAGVLDDGVILRQTWEQFERTFAPKLHGSANLHTLTRALPLDYFVMFSSTAALFGAAGQGNYAAANAFMDALAHQRRRQGLPALSVNWGPWSEIGMAVSAGAISEEVRSAHGIEALSPEQGLDALEALLLDGTRPQMGVICVDWQRALASSSAVARGSLFKDLVQAAASAADDGAVLSALLAVPEVERGAALERYLRECVGAVLRLDPDKVERDRPLTAMGFDSLLALELRERVERELRVGVPIVHLFRGDSIAEFAAHLFSELRKKHTEAFTSAALAPEELLAEVDGLSDDAVDALLRDVAAQNEMEST